MYLTLSTLNECTSISLSPKIPKETIAVESQAKKYDANVYLENKTFKILYCNINLTNFYLLSSNYNISMMKRG